MSSRLCVAFALIVLFCKPATAAVWYAPQQTTPYRTPVVVVIQCEPQRQPVRRPAPPPKASAAAMKAGSGVYLNPDYVEKPAAKPWTVLNPYVNWKGGQPQ